MTKSYFWITIVAFLFCSVFVHSQNVDVTLDQFQVDDTSPDEAQNIEFTLRLNNIGVNTATNIQISNILPTSFIYVSDDASGAFNSGFNMWTVSSLALGVKSLIVDKSIQIESKSITYEM
jgi:uncharacterized repeat protein (TIGR01451 family)